VEKTSFHTILSKYQNILSYTEQNINATISMILLSCSSYEGNQSIEINSLGLHPWISRPGRGAAMGGHRSTHLGARPIHWRTSLKGFITEILGWRVYT
jgi:hypothetical protein